jgi:hypothetical protein
MAEWVDWYVFQEQNEKELMGPCRFVTRAGDAVTGWCPFVGDALKELRAREREAWGLDSSGLTQSRKVAETQRNGGAGV